MGFMGTPRWPSAARTGRTIRAVARLAKLSGFGPLGAVESHQARTRPTPNADPARLADNEWLIRAEGGLVDAVRTRIERAELLRREAWEADMAAWQAAGGKKAAGPKPRQPQKRKSDAVVAVEIVLSASPEFFRPDDAWTPGVYDRERMTAWRDASVAWLRDRYGADLMSAVLHLDEATPHIHAIITPLTKDGRLSAYEVVGGRESLRRFQDSVAKGVAHLGIERGVEGSVAHHTDADEYYTLVNKPRAPEPVEVAVGTPPLMVTGREKWAVEETGRVKARVEPMLQAAEAKTNAAELAHEQVRRLPAIVAGVRAEAAAATKAIEARAEARVKAANREAEIERQRAAKAERKADIALEAAKTATEALKAERQAQAALVREMPLATVLRAAGWEQDVGDLRYWHGPGSRIRVDGPRSAWDEEQNRGAKNAIDLARLLTGRDYADAVAWLSEVVGHDDAHHAALAVAQEAVLTEPEPFELPAPAPATWPAVREELVQKRRLSERLVDDLRQIGLLISRPRGFMLAMRDLDEVTVGAERYGSGRVIGLFRRSRRDRGGFRLVRGTKGLPRDVFLTESGLDALSLHELVPPDPKRQQMFVATSGATSRVPWLRELMAEGARLIVAYGQQPASEWSAKAIMDHYPRTSVRWVPQGADWNEHLVGQADRAAAAEAEPEREEEQEPTNDAGLAGGRP